VRRGLESSAVRLLSEVQRAAAMERLSHPPQPPWRPIPSRDLCKILGVSLQSLANWRVRGTGPTPEPFQKGGGNRTYYRPDEVLSWLAGGQPPAWEFSSQWLSARGLEIDEPSEASTAWLIEQADPLL